VSKTDKTRPHWVKEKELPVNWRWMPPEFGCGHNCGCQYGWYRMQKRKDRRERKAAARNWRKEYE
jgi:hypothetical protein